MSIIISEGNQLLRSREPLTADEVFLSLRESDTSVCLATIYRNLTLLFSKGLATKSVSASDGKSRFALASRDHRHQLVCTACNRRIDLAGCPLEAFERRVMAETSYSMLSHHLELYGLCPDYTVQAEKR
ncbi:MAG: transcriptional repressor [Firmicutes bacterium]|nr:transcriptional repressor [Bacillota bacterium]